MNDTQEVSIKFKNTITGDAKLKEYEKRLQNIYSYISSINSGQLKSVKQLGEATKDVNKEVKNVSDNTEKMAKKFNIAFDVKSIKVYLNTLQQVSKQIMSLVSSSSSYIENVNLLEVAYHNANETIEESSARIEEFIDKMAEVYGLDESRLTRQFGIFKQLANAMKLPTETAENLSELMVKMTNDIASLYNLPLSRASNALQSALAGQVRPIRSATGADITEKTLQQTVDALGLEKNISQLSYVEKRLIMVISLTEQLKNSQGDYGRTIEGVSNQIRVMHEQWDRLARSVGNVFYPILEKVLPYLNATLMVLTEIFNLISTMMGFKMPKFDYSGLAGASDATLDLIDGMNEAGSSVDKLKEKLSGLRGFDKLNVISTPKDSGTTSSSGIDPAIMDAFNAKFGSYNDMLDEVNMKAKQIRDAMLDWLGFTDGTYTNLKIIGAILGTIAGLKLISGIAGLITGTSKLSKILGTGGLYKSLKNLFTLFKTGEFKKIISGKLASAITTISKLFTPTGLLITGLVALGATFVYLYKTNEEFRQKINEIVSVFKDNLQPLFQYFTDTIIPDLKNAWDSLINIIKPFADFLGGVFVDIWNKLLIPLFEYIAKQALPILINTFKNLWENILVPLGNFIGKTLTPIFQILSDVLSSLWKAIIEPLSNYILNIFKKSFEGLFDVINNTVIPVFNGLINCLDFFLNDFLMPIVSFLWDKFKPAFEVVFKNIETIINGLSKTLGGIIDFITGVFSGNWSKAWNGIKDIFSGIFETIKNLGLNALGKISEKISNVIGDFKKLYNEMSYNPDTGHSGLQGLWENWVGGMKLIFGKADGGVYANGKWNDITAYAGGGLPPVGQMFVARENGPELVGKIGSHTAVMNNDQIVGSVSDGVYRAMLNANKGQSQNPQIFNIYLDDAHKIGTYTLEQLQDMAKTNGRPITIG